MEERGGYSGFSFIFPGFLWPWFDVEHARTGLIKWGEEFRQALGTSRPHLIMSDDEYGGGGGGGGDYDYGGPRCVRLRYLVSVCVADLCCSFTEDTFVRSPSAFCTRIDCLRKKRTTDTTSWPKTPRTTNKPVQMASKTPVRSTQPMATLVVTRRWQTANPRPHLRNNRANANQTRSG